MNKEMILQALHAALLFAESEVENRGSAGGSETDYVNEAHEVVDAIMSAMTELGRG